MENVIGSEGNNMKELTQDQINERGDELCNTCEKDGATWVAQRIINKRVHVLQHGQVIEVLAVCNGCRFRMIDDGFRHEFTAIQD